MQKAFPDNGMSMSQMMKYAFEKEENIAEKVENIVEKGENIDLIPAFPLFLCPSIKRSGAYCFTIVCLSVCLSICLSAQT